MNSIKGRGNHMGVHNFKFPEYHKNKNSLYNYSINNNRQLNITEHDIEKIINSAFETAKKCVSMVNMTPLLRNKKIYSLVELSKFVKAVLNKSCSKIVDYTDGDDSDKDSDDDEFEDDEIDSAVFDDEEQIPNMTDEEEEEENDDERNILSNSLSHISQQDFKGCRIYDKINRQQMQKYFRINIDSSIKYIHKQTACWFLTTSKNRLSNDRLERVKGR
jgi:hypothetical protein